MMKTLLLCFSLLSSVALAQHAPQQAGSQPLEPALEARVQTLAKELRCAVCQGMSVADSPASMARSQLDKVRELVQAGRTDQEIRDYFVARYGEWVLLEPKTEGITLFVWLAPAFALLLGLALVVMYVRSSARTPLAVATPSETPNPTVEEEPADEYLRAVRAELER